MNKELLALMTFYATENHDSLKGYLLDKPKEKIVSTLTALLVNYFNDKNSSSLRQYVTVHPCGYKLSHKKIGYNGYKQSSVDGSTLHCEAKPKNINTNDTTKKKLDGGGNFTDYTWARFVKVKKANPIISVSGFVDGRLIYIFRFPFNSTGFVDNLRKKLERRFPDGDKSGEYLRSAGFSFADYMKTESFKVESFLKKRELDSYRDYLTRNIYRVLTENAQLQK